MTLLELLVVLVILTSALWFSPLLFRTTPKAHAEQLTHEITHMLRYAVLQAFLRQERLILMPLESNNWAKGGRLLVMNNARAFTDQDVLRVWHWKHDGVRLNWHGFQATDALKIEFSPMHLALNGRFILESTDSENVIILVNRFGFVSKHDS